MRLGMEGVGVTLAGTGCSADLGGSSKYSNENFEDPKWRKVSREQYLDASEPLLSDREIPF